MEQEENEKPFEDKIEEVEDDELPEHRNGRRILR